MEVSKNKNLSAAKSKKDDEFYTRLEDIETELKFYKGYFKDKVVYCNCDDPSWSNFYKYFKMNFRHLELKRLISTHYSKDTSTDKAYKKECYYDDSGVFIEKDTDLINDGDFRSDECIKLLNESDIVCTNPPFSLFREYVDLLISSNKQFLIIGNSNAITCKEIFTFFKINKIWLGVSHPKEFQTPDNNFKKFGNICWYTNLLHNKRKETIQSWRTYTVAEYQKYDNCDAIEISTQDMIPLDYDDVMGVPITFLEKYNPDQFEIMGITKTWFKFAKKIYPSQIQFDKSGKQSKVGKLNDGAVLKIDTPPENMTYYKVGTDIYIQKYVRILVRRKKMQA